mmetsp:Transcript_32982/g.104373  ORF Transcript_32982/g.104373 Transcript_32982/m.104373 type:complete len:131 (-) Transcript_32982:221-613(-)
MQWVLAGRKRRDSPIQELMAEHGVSRNYFARLLAKLSTTGSVANRPRRRGRPKHRWDHWGPLIARAIQARRRQRRAAPVSHIRKQLASWEPEATLPSAEQIRRWMIEHGLHTVRVRVEADHGERRRMHEA